MIVAWDMGLMVHESAQLCIRLYAIPGRMPQRHTLDLF